MKLKLISYLILAIAAISCFYGCNSNKKVIDNVDTALVNNIKESQIDCFTILIYASEDKVIFHGVIGLVVYDLNKKEITDALDVKSINMNTIQGDEATVFKISNDGNKILMYNENYLDNAYVYDVEANTLEQTDANSKEFDNMRETKYIFDDDTLKDLDIEYPYGMCVNDDKICYLAYPPNVEKGIEGLQIIMINKNSKEKDVYNVFE